MTKYSRRSVLKAVAGLPVLGGYALSQTQDYDNDLIEVDLEARQQWTIVGGQSAYLHTFNGRVPGPLIQAKPGSRIRIRFRNNLPEETNLHYHGLHIPPGGNADNVFLHVAPGEEFLYEFDLPVDHPGGTFLYHPHLHGAAARQVSRGLVGVFVVRGELDQIPEIAAAPEFILVLQDFALSANGLPTEPAMMERVTGRQGDLITVSGLLQPSIPIQRSGWTRLRILNASSSRFYRLRLEKHSFRVISSDGGPLRSPEEVEEVLLVPGERVPANGRVRLRIRFRDFAGTTVYHCHIRDHEDLGMMGVLEIDEAFSSSPSSQGRRRVRDRSR